MLKAAAGQQHGQILRGMTAAVAKVAAEKHGRAIQQIAVSFLGLLQAGQQISDGLHRLQFNDFQLSQFPGILAVMGQIVVAECDSVDGRREA